MSKDSNSEGANYSGLQLDQGDVDGDGGINRGKSDRFDQKHGSAQSESSDEQVVLTSDSKTSTQPDTNDDTTSDDFKVPLAHTEDQSESKLYDEQKPSSHQNANTSDSKSESFSMQLMRMLSSEARAGSEAVQWLPDGRGFVIRNQQEFEQKVLPRYFDGPCIFQSFVRRLYRWGFKQIDKSTAGSGHYVFKNEVFHRDTDVYQKMKPLPRSKKEPRKHQMPSNDTHNTVGDTGISMAANHQQGLFEAHGTNIVQGIAVSSANENNMLPPQLASAQNELVQLVNTIVTTYSSSPALLTSLQSNLADILRSVPPPQPGSMQQQAQVLNNIINETVQTGSQEPVTLIIDGIIRFLAQRQGILLPPAIPGQSMSFPPLTSNIGIAQDPPALSGTAQQQGLPTMPGQPMSFLPPTSSNTGMPQQQGVAPPLLSSSVPGYNSQLGPNVLLNNPNIQSLWGNQAQLHRHAIAMQPYGPTPSTNTNSIATTTSSSNDPEANNVGRATSETSFSNDADESSTCQAATTIEGQTIPRGYTRKRERSPSPDDS